MTLTLSGPQKAAVVLTQLDTTRAGRLLRSLTEEEAVSLMAVVAALPPLDDADIRAVLAEFSVGATAAVHVGQGGADVARKLLSERLGAGRAAEIVAQFAEAGKTHPLSFLEKVDPQQIAAILADEHDQLAAVVLAHLSPDVAAAVISHVDIDRRGLIARRVATMGRIAPDVVAKVADTIDQRLAAVYRGGVSNATEVGGLSTVVAILNQTDRSSERQILGDLESCDPELAEEIRNEMFVFDDVVNLDDRTLQRVLRNVVPKDLALALKNMNETVREKFLRNLSERARADLNDEIELLGPTRLSQVEAAQTSVVRVVRELEAAGEIVLARGEEDELV